MILFLALVVPAMRARADGEAPTSGAPEAPAAPKPSAAATPPRARAMIEWRDVFWGDRYGHVLHAEKPFRNGRLLEGEALYLALDRPDLAEAYRKNQETKTGLAAASGIFLATALIAATVASIDQKNGRAAPVGALVGLGISVTLTGVFAIANACTPADPVTDDDLHRLVDVHNRTP